MMSDNDVLSALESALRREMLWWDEKHGHTESFRIGMQDGLSTAIAKILFLRKEIEDGEKAGASK